MKRAWAKSSWGAWEPSSCGTFTNIQASALENPSFYFIFHVDTPCVHHAHETSPCNRLLALGARDLGHKHSACPLERSARKIPQHTDTLNRQQCMRKGTPKNTIIFL